MCRGQPLSVNRMVPGDNSRSHSRSSNNSASLFFVHSAFTASHFYKHVLFQPSIFLLYWPFPLSPRDPLSTLLPASLRHITLTTWFLLLRLFTTNTKWFFLALYTFILPKACNCSHLVCSFFNFPLFFVPAFNCKFVGLGHTPFVPTATFVFYLKTLAPWRVVRHPLFTFSTLVEHLTLPLCICHSPCPRIDQSTILPPCLWFTIISIS